VGRLRPRGASPAHGQVPGHPPGASQGPSDSFRKHIICFSAEMLQTLWKYHRSASHFIICFQKGAWFHLLSRYSSAFVTYVNLLWIIHGKANYCADTVFRQTFNVSSGSERGTSDSPSPGWCMIAKP